MSRSPAVPPGPWEPLTLLHRRLLQAEEEAEALVRDVGSLGAPGGRAAGPAPFSSPLKEHRAPGGEAVVLRARLQRACRERDEALREVGRLGERLQEAAAANREVALAADELKIVTVETSQKLAEMRRQLEDEAQRRRALRTRLVQQLQNQDFLLAAVRRNVHTELQVALRDKVNLQSELEKLTDEHAELLQSSSTARETADTQREQLERTIERLRGEPQLERTIERLRGEPQLERTIERPRGEPQLERTIERLRGEPRPQEGPMRKDQQGSRTRVSELEAEGQTTETLQEDLHLNRQSQQQEPGDSARLQARREIGKHRAEVEKLQRLLTSTHSKSSRALKSLQKASAAARVDNKRLAQSLDRHRAAATLRDEELREARAQIVRLSEELGAAKREISKASPKQEAELQRWTSTIRRWEDINRRRTLIYDS